MENITRTVYGCQLQNLKVLNLPFEFHEYSTLNKKFGIEESATPTLGTYPSLNYFTIGNGGHKLTVGSNNIPKPEPNQHLATDASLFKHLPFILRELNNDISMAERQKFGLRRIEEYNGTKFIAYYLKRIDMSGVTSEMILRTVDEHGNITSTPFVPDTSNLEPVPQDLSPSGINLVAGKYVITTSKLSLSFSESDMNEIRNVANIIYSDEALAIISEIGLVSAVDKTVQVNNPGMPPFNFKEVIAAQIFTHINVFFSAMFSNRGFNIILDTGATEPLFKLVSP